VNKWLLNFAYRIEASLWMFITALALTALIAVSATFYVSWKASMVSPGESLKYE
jgi:putative ABC transport system permease protein